MNFTDIYTGEVLISTYNRKLLVTDEFSEMGFILPSQRCYGLGQRNGQFKLAEGAYTMWAKYRDEGLPEDDAFGGKNGNHIQPFIMCQTANSSDWVGMFFVGNAPQVFEVILFDQDPKKTVVNYITIGGPLEIWVFTRLSAQDLLAKYHSLIGKAQMTPYYALGMFHGSNSYKQDSQIQAAIDGFAQKKMGLEGIIIDNYNPHPHYSFQVDATNFKNLPSMVDSLHSNNQKVVMGASFALADSNDNLYFTRAIANKCLIDSFVYRNQQVVGVLDNTFVKYLDPFHPGFTPFLQEALPALSSAVNGMDGLNVQDAYTPNQVPYGEIGPDQTVQKTGAKSNMRSLYTVNEAFMGGQQPYLLNETDEEKYIPSTFNLPFIPDWKTNNYQNLDAFTISLNATTNGGSRIATQFNHNGNAAKILAQSYKVMASDESNKRPFILSDASWVGSGQYAIGLITNMFRSWENLTRLLNQVYMLGTNGIHAMVDSCGSLGPMDEELCARWSQLSAFMPLMRNFFNETYFDKQYQSREATDAFEPWKFQNEDFGFAYAGAISDRLKYSRYMFSQMYAAYRTGGSIVRPLFFDYPMDVNAHDFSNSTFMLGDSIKVSPVLEKGLKEGSEFKSYFPQGKWYDLHDLSSSVDTTAAGQQVTLKASFTQTNIHLKAGKIIPFQKNSQSFSTTSQLAAGSKMGLIVARDTAKSYADGYILVDDGISQNSFSENEFTFWKVRYAEKSINFWVQYGNHQYSPEGQLTDTLDYIDIVDAEDISDTNFACYMNTDLTPVNLMYDYNQDTKVLRLKKISTNPDIKFKDLGLIKFGNKDKEVDLCDQSAFTYTVSMDPQDQQDNYQRIQLIPGQTHIDTLVAEFTLLDDQGTINVEITSRDDFDSGKKKLFRVPTPTVYDVTQFAGPKNKKITDFLKITLSPFSYAVYQNAADESTLLWKSDPNHLYFSDYFIVDSGVFSTNPANNYPLLGMGEKAGNLFYRNEDGFVHSRYTFDQANPVEDGLPPGKNFYGYQPFYIYQSNTLKWAGVFDISSYATDYIVRTTLDDNKKTQIHKITIGGTITKFFFQGDTIDTVIKTYTKLVGRPTVPPLWAFGWQQCRFGYTTVDEWWQVYENYKANNIPLDVMWADIDYMDDYKLFTVSPTYQGFDQKISQLKSEGRRFVPIMDAGVAVRKDQGYKTLEDGLEKKVFIMQSDGKNPLTAGVWPGHAYFPDFHNPDTVQWWSDNFDYLHDGLNLKFDGVWLDENEATNFCNGYCITEERPADSLRNKPFYVPGWRDLEDQALGVDGLHVGGVREYDVHNLYPLMQSKATAEYLAKKLSEKDQKQARPYVLSRSNFPGIGKYAHHWLGDNWSSVEYMALSVSGVYSFNLFGLPFIGSDICGFNGDAAPDICTRWHQLGTLYPFSRNHNQNGSASQEPFVFTQSLPNNPSKTYADVMKTAIKNRYSLIRYYYSSFQQIGDIGGSFFKPMFFNYPNDPKAYDEIMIRSNILLGDALKASINTETLDFTKNPTTDFYFPEGVWCQIIPSFDATQCYDTTGSNTKTVNLKSGIEDYYVHIKSGSIIPWEDTNANQVMTTRDLENLPTSLLIFTNSANSQMNLQSGDVSASSAGFIYLDDGLTYDESVRARFDFYTTNNEDGTFSLVNMQSATQNGAKVGNQHDFLGIINFIGVSKTPGLKDVNHAQIVTINNETIDMGDFISYNPTEDRLSIKVMGTDGSKTWTFWDFKKINLSKK